MHKVFKYDLYQRDNKWFFMGPKNAIVIRTDEIHDQYYDGIFCWAIVDPDDKEMVEHETAFSPSNFDFNRNTKKLLGFLEEQYIEIPNRCKIDGLKSENGLAFLHYHTLFENNYETKRVKLILRKTGQEIGYPIDKLIYIGWLFIFIKQELAVYGFLVDET